MGSQRGKLNPIKDLYPTVKVASDETVIGHTKAGNIVVQRTVTRSRKEPIIDPKTKQQVYRRNQTGFPVVPMFKKIEFQEVEEYEKIPTRDGGVRRNFGYKPDPEEQKRIERRKRIAETQEQLVEAMVDNDLSIDSLIGVLKDDAPKRTRAKA